MSVTERFGGKILRVQVLHLDQTWSRSVLLDARSFGGLLERSRHCSKMPACASPHFPLSMLLINLATSDFLLATGKILYLITARIVASWCSETTVMSKSLCFTAYLLSNMSCSMTTLTSATIASFGFKVIVGCCCCSSGRNSKRQVFVILTFTWLISIAYAAAMIKNDRSHLTSIEINGSSFIDWHIC